jgi:predicted RNase H-like HicB family nuclease
MEIPVLIEPMSEGGFRAQSSDPFPLAAQGDTPDSALRNLRDLVDQRITVGTYLISLEIPASPRGPHPGAGMYRDDPLFDRWKAEIEAYRQEIEDDPEIPSATP